MKDKNVEKLYEEMSLDELVSKQKKQTKRVTIYFIGVCVFFFVSFFLGMQIHTYFVAFTAFLFTGFLLVFYMQTLIFIRVLGVIKYGDKYIEQTKNSKDDI